MDRFVMEAWRQLPVSERCDVCVAGGGIAGVAAALAAARNGKKVVLIEREYGLGGMATLGLIAVYLPLCDGRGNQVIGGISEELLRLSIKHGASEGYPYPHAWLEGGTKEEREKNRFMVQFNPVFFALEMEKLLVSEGVKILYGTLVSDVIKRDPDPGKAEENEDPSGGLNAGKVKKDGKSDAGFIDYIIIENKSGRSAVKAAMYIDATGDADLAFRAGVGCSLLPQKNALASWYYYKNSRNKVLLSMFGLADVRPGNGEHSAYNETEGQISATRFSGVDGGELSLAVQEAHAMMLGDILEKKEKDEAYEPVSMSSIPLVRMSRKINGAATLTKDQDHEYVSDSIGMTGDWTKRGPVYEIPFGALYCEKIPNLLTAGRCISTDNEVWNVTRVIPPCAVTGEAAGTAAAMCLDPENNMRSDPSLETCAGMADVRNLSVEKLQANLRKQNVLLHMCEAGNT